MLNLGQSRRPGRGWWRMLLDQYGASDVVVPEVYLERRNARRADHRRASTRGTGRTAPFSAASRCATGSADGLDRLLDEGVRRIDALYVEALRDGGLLRPDPSLAVEEPDAARRRPAFPTDDGDPLAAIVDNVTDHQPDTCRSTRRTPAPLDQARGRAAGGAGRAAGDLTSLALGGTSLLSREL